MKMNDCLIIRTLNRESGMFEQRFAENVLCTVTDKISVDESGYMPDGQLIVRIPEREEVPISLGDEVSHNGGVTWFVVTEIRDNLKRGSKLSHRKVIGRR